MESLCWPDGSPKMKDPWDNPPGTPPEFAAEDILSWAPIGGNSVTFHWGFCSRTSLYERESVKYRYPSFLKVNCCWKGTETVIRLSFVRGP